MKNKLKILLLYYIPDSYKSKNWKDGFTAAIKILEKEFIVDWVNLFEREPVAEEMEKFDFILAKSNWNWKVDLFLRKKNKGLKTPRGIMISGSQKPPFFFGMNYYQVLFYETPWYKRSIKRHPNIVHAFGVDTELMKPMDLDKEYDLISIGTLSPIKRHELLLQKEGKRIIIGHIPDTAEAQALRKKLEAGGIEIIPFLAYDQLCSYYNKSKKTFVGCSLQGGGERAVLESRACGVEVEIAEDNPKLNSLSEVPVWDQYYYAKQLKTGILSCLKP